MAVTKAEFQAMANRLLNNTFADFAQSISFTTQTGYDPLTGQYATEVSLSASGIVLEYDAREIDGESIQANDKQVIFEAAQFTTFDPRVDNVKMNIDGVEYNIVSVYQDPASAIYIIQARA